jgi:hypothetical protein
MLHAGRCTFTPIHARRIDLEDQRAVSRQEAEHYAGTVGALFLETSAITAKGVAQLFQALGMWLTPP